MANGTPRGMAEETRLNMGAMFQRIVANEQIIGNVAASVNALTTRVETMFTSLASKIDDKTATRWPVIWAAMGVGVSVLALFGAMAYAPINSSVARNERATEKIAESIVVFTTAVAKDFVTVRELDARTARGQTDFSRAFEQIKEIRNDLVSRSEHAERWRAQDQAVANLQRQIDVQAAQFGQVYSAKDVIARMEREIEMLKRDRQRPAGS